MTVVYQPYDSSTLTIHLQNILHLASPISPYLSAVQLPNMRPFYTPLIPDNAELPRQPTK